ncbi:MAG: TonB-dependent receptor [Niabella sp.]|nr:TonB-dependent receptor [Niabella sp.]
MRHAYPNTLKLLTLILTSFIASATFSQAVLKGKITDAKTGEALAGATVQLDGSHMSVLTNLDGTYLFKQVKPGNYELKVSYEGYKKAEDINIVLQPIATLVRNVALEQNITELSEVNITTAAVSGSDRSARQIEKNAAPIVSVLSAQTMQLLPDLTVGNSLQRISGVSVQRSGSGEARHAIIRGMDQRYNNTLVNGVKVSSPDPRYRSLPLDLFPSEILERLEVVKSGLPSIEGDFVGGSVNMVMKSAPEKFMLQANASTGFSTLFSSSRPFQAYSHSAANAQSPAERMGSSYNATASDFPKGTLNYTNKNLPFNTTAGFTIGGRTHDNKLGVLTSASYQNIYRGDNNTFLMPNAQPQILNLSGGGHLDNQAVISDLYLRNYSTQTARIAVHNKIDYVFNNRNSIALYNMYVHMNEFETRNTYDSVYLNKLTDNLMRSRTLKQSIYNGTLRGDHTLSDVFGLNWTGTYSIAKGAQPDWAEYDYQGANNSYIAQNMTRIWQHNKNQDLAGYLNFLYRPEIAGSKVEFSLGGMYRHRTRDNYQIDYKLTPVTVGGVPQSWTDFNSATYQFKSADAGIESKNINTSNTYTSHENVGAGYLQAKFTLLQKLEVIGGARAEHTLQNYATIAPATSVNRSGTVSYTDLLPSAILRYALTSDQNIRFSYFRSIIRPDFYQIVPTEDIGEEFNIKGNPYLKHTKADNIDLKYEIFPGGSAQFSVGAFYKAIYDPIELGITRDGGPSAQYLTPLNFGTARDYGIEAVFSKYFGMFGVSANYTYTKSKITTTKQYYYKDDVKGATFKTVNQTRPMQGTSPSIGNLSLLYKNPHIGLDLQLAFVYVGERISIVSPYYNLDYWQAPQELLSFSFEKRFCKKFSLYGKVNNLTNQPVRRYIKQSPQQSAAVTLPDQIYSNKTVVGKDIYNMDLQTGVRYKF